MTEQQPAWHIRSIPIDTVKIDEQWCEAVLVNGDKVRIRLIINEVRQIVDEKNDPITDENGYAKYLVNFSQVINFPMGNLRINKEK